MIVSLLLALLLPGARAEPPGPARGELSGETVVIDCPGLRCEACQLGVLEGSQGFPGVRSVQFDRARARLTIAVVNGFDRHHELILAIQRVADPIEMFRATMIHPRQVFLYLDRHPGEAEGEALAGVLRSVPGVKSVYRDDRDVVSIAMADGASRAEILRRAGSLGYRGELFETRYRANVESRISEESHHLIGVLLLAMSFLLLFDRAVGGGTWASEVLLPRLWILAGVLVLAFSDLDSWPFVRSLADSLCDKMIVQHKILGLGMVLLGIAEGRRGRTDGWRIGASLLFLAVAALSGVMLQFHFPDLVDPAHLRAWRWVNRQHFVAAVVGGVALLARAADDFRWIPWPAFSYAWPALLGAEGVLLCLFVEPVW